MALFFRVENNEGEYYCLEQPTQDQLNSYIWEKLQQGVEPDEIMFYWVPVRAH